MNPIERLAKTLLHEMMHVCKIGDKLKGEIPLGEVPNPADALAIECLGIPGCKPLPAYPPGPPPDVPSGWDQCEVWERPPCVPVPISPPGGYIV